MYDVLPREGESEVEELPPAELDGGQGGVARLVGVGVRPQPLLVGNLRASAYNACEVH